MELVLGTAQLTSPYGVLQESVSTGREDATEFLIKAEGLGFTALDTAPAYQGAESAIGIAGTSLGVHTKLDPSTEPRDSMMRSLKRLRRTSVDVAYFHDPEAPINLTADEIAETASRLEGLVQVLGASVYGGDACRATFHHESFGCLQIPVHPLKRDLLEVVQREKRPDIQVLARSVLGQGLLVAAIEQIPSSLSHLVAPIVEFQDACQMLERTPLEVSLLWVRDQPLLDGLVVGAASLVQLQELSHVLHLPPLSDDERCVIDALQQPEPFQFDPRTWK